MLCKVCGVKEPTLFYSSMPSYCKEHWRERVRANRAEKVHYYRSFDRMRASMPHRVAARKEYAATEAGKAAARAAKRKWAELNAHKTKAATIINNAIKRGKLEKQPCFICGAEAEAHHPSYALPWDVVWLCSQHHAQVHKEARQYERETASAE